MEEKKIINWNTSIDLTKKQLFAIIIIMFLLVSLFASLFGYTYYLYRMKPPFPQQQYNWCTPIGTYYIGIYKSYNSFNETTIGIVKIYINETRNNLNQLINENETYSLGTCYSWCSIEYLRFAFVKECYLRNPFNKTLYPSSPNVAPLIPLFYNNYLTSIKMINRSFYILMDMAFEGQPINYFCEYNYQEIYSTLLEEPCKNMPFYNDEFPINGIYQTIYYNIKISCVSPPGMYISFIINSIVEANSGIPLYTTFLIKMTSPSYNFSEIVSFQTILTSIKLPNL